MFDSLESLYQHITRKILDVYPMISSLYVTGSFGRNEGSYTIENNQITIYNDIDILVIIEDNTTIDSTKTEIISSYYKDILNIPYFDIGIKRQRQITQSKPSIELYDLVHGSKLLYGSDITKQLNVTIADLSSFEFTRLLCNRTAGLLTADFIDNRVSYKIIQQYKALIAVGDAILFRTFGYYESSYQKRLVFLEEHKDIILQKYLPQEFDLIIQSYKRKLDVYHSYDVIGFATIRKLILMSIVDLADLKKNTSPTILYLKLLFLYEAKRDKQRYLKLLSALIFDKNKAVNYKAALLLTVFTLIPDRQSRERLTSFFIRKFIPKASFREELPINHQILHTWLTYCH